MVLRSGGELNMSWPRGSTRTWSQLRQYQEKISGGKACWGKKELDGATTGQKLTGGGCGGEANKGCAGIERESLREKMRDERGKRERE